MDLFLHGIQFLFFSFLSLWDSFKVKIWFQNLRSMDRKPLWLENNGYLQPVFNVIKSGSWWRASLSLWFYMCLSDEMTLFIMTQTLWTGERFVNLGLETGIDKYFFSRIFIVIGIKINKIELKNFENQESFGNNKTIIHKWGGTLEFTIRFWVLTH